MKRNGIPFPKSGTMAFDLWKTFSLLELNGTKTNPEEVAKHMAVNNVSDIPKLSYISTILWRFRTHSKSTPEELKDDYVHHSLKSEKNIEVIAPTEKQQVIAAVEVEAPVVKKKMNIKKTIATAVVLAAMASGSAQAKRPTTPDEPTPTVSAPAWLGAEVVNRDRLPLGNLVNGVKPQYGEMLFKDGTFYLSQVAKISNFVNNTCTDGIIDYREEFEMVMPQGQVVVAVNEYGEQLAIALDSDYTDRAPRYVKTSNGCIESSVVSGYLVSTFEGEQMPLILDVSGQANTNGVSFKPLGAN